MRSVERLASRHARKNNRPARRFTQAGWNEGSAACLNTLRDSPPAIYPVAWASPMMRNRNDAKLFSGDLIDDAVRKSGEKIAAPRATKYRPEYGVLQNKICRSLKLGHEGEPEFDIRLGRIESRRILQLGECEWNNDKLHFNAART